MKSLYESILDDEDILTSKVNRIVTNPFLTLKSLRGKDLAKYKDEIISILEAFPLPKSPKLKNANYVCEIDNHTYEIGVGDREKIDVIDGNKKNFNKILNINMDPAHPAHSLFADDRDIIRDIIIIYFDEQYFHTNSLRSYAKKYGLKSYYGIGNYNYLYI